jgi:protein-S-isoprenylcysteine O-methyltransferase Ste14
VGASWLIVIPLYVLPGLDWRFGWSKVPLWAVIVATLVLVAGYALFVLVMRTNSYASRVIELNEGQKVIDSGPYALVRHPMYVSSITIYVASPIVLGSWWALIPAFVFPFLMVLRIRSEEAFLRKELPGYEEYAKRVPWRLIPGIY